MMYLTLTAVVCVLSAVSSTRAQTISTTTLLNPSNTTLSIVNASTEGMPIRLSTGPLGQIISLEVDSRGGTWLRGPVSIGSDVGATTREQMRVGQIATNSGTGIHVALTNTLQSTGVAIRDIGPNGSDHAGLLLTSQANGTGTGIRIGGLLGSGRSTLQTGIDIVGGLGIRYNALYSGIGTALDIGGTNPPKRGIEVVTAGTDHIGITSRANTSGTGIVGISQSLNSEPLLVQARTGVIGYAASNSALSSDTLTGAMGQAVRAGSGGTQTVSFGLFGRAISRSSQHSGTSIGVYGEAASQSVGQYTTISGCFVGSGSTLSLVACGGDIVLGGRRELLPRQIVTPFFTQHNMLTTVTTYDACITGTASIHQLCLPPSGGSAVVAGFVATVDVSSPGVQRIETQGAVAQLGGLECTVQSGRVVHILVDNGPVTLRHDEMATPAELRFQLPNQEDIVLVSGIVYSFWYDAQDQCWRLLR